MIAAARAALAKGDVREALEQLLAAWRATPARVLADAIDAVGKLAAYGMHAPSGTSQLDRDYNWLAEAKRGDIVTRGLLAETIIDTIHRAMKMERARALVAAGTDPRTAMALVALVASGGMPWQSEFSTIWNPLFEMIAAAGDPRVREALARTDWNAIVIGTPRQKETFRQRIAKYDVKLAKVFPAVPELAYEETRIVEEMIAMARAPSAAEVGERETEAALLAAVHAAPGDLGVRAIYGDYLQQRGDPRGELIALQLAHPPGTRVPLEIHNRLQQLFHQHAAKWTGALGAHVSHDIYRQGFLDEVRFRKQAAYDSPYVDPPPDAMWSTVRTAVGGVPATDALPMPILERALEIDHRGMRALARLSTAPPLCEIEWRGMDPARDGEAVADFTTIVRRTPTLRKLTLRGPGAEALAWPWRGSSIRVLIVEAPSRRLAHWLAQIDALDEITVKHDHWSTKLTATGALVAKQERTGNFADVLPHLERAIDGIGERIVAAEITVSAKEEWRAPERKRMESLLARHPRWAGSAKIYGFKRT